MEKHYLEINWSTLWRILIFVLLAFFLYFIKNIVMMTAAAFIIAVICQPLVDFLQKKRVARVLGTSLIFVLMLVVLVFFIYLVVPLVISQLNNFFVNFNENIAALADKGILKDLSEQIFLNLKTVLSAFSGGAAGILSFIFSVFGGIFAVFTCGVLAFYFTLEEKAVENFFRFCLPESYENKIITIFKNSAKRINRWFQSRVLLSLFVGLLSWAGLSLLKVDYSFTLALIIGFLDILPFIGPFIAGVLAFLVSLKISWILGIWVALFLFIVQQLENIIFTPWLMKKATGLSPLVILLALLIGAKIAGLLGFILAIPITIIAQEIFREFEKKQTE